MKQLLFVLIAFLSVATTAFSQSAKDIILTGKVFETSTKEPFVGAVVVIKKTTNGIVTDLNGAFRLTVVAKDSATTVVVSAVGFVSKEFKINEFMQSKTEENVFVKDLFLDEDTKTLSEVVVVGYATAKRSEVSRSVSKISSSGAAEMPAKATKDKAVSKAIAVAGIATTSAPISYKKGHKTEGKLTTKTSETRDVLKVKKALSVFADDFISVPKTSSFLEEIAKTTIKEQIEDEEIAAEPSAGQLTAGEWSDLKNWDFWKKSLNEAFKPYANDWRINVTQRYSFILRGASKQLISDATVQLLDKNGTAIWSAKTDNSGRAELFADAFGKTEASKISVQYGGKTYNLDKIKPFEAGVNELKIPVTCSFSPTVDIAFVVDATSSMTDEIAYLKVELADVIRQVKRENQALSMRLGSVFYRDFGDEYVTRIAHFDNSLKKNVDFIKKQSANGGGDFPEAVPEGLEAAIDSMAWSDNALARLLFLVLDAPPHLDNKNVEKLQRLTAKAAQKGIRIIPIAASGVDKNTEYLMKVFAVATGGTYTFLTDDSGIGNGHLKATAEKYDVEFLNALLVRLIKQYSNYEACNIIATEAATGGDTKLGLNFTTFPNPVHSVLNIDLKTPVTAVFITNAQGQIVQKLGIFTEGVQSIDVSNLASGVYFVHFQKAGAVCTKKISVVK